MEDCDSQKEVVKRSIWIQIPLDLKYTGLTAVYTDGNGLLKSKPKIGEIGLRGHTCVRQVDEQSLVGHDERRSRWRSDLGINQEASTESPSNVSKWNNDLLCAWDCRVIHTQGCNQGSD